MKFFIKILVFSFVIVVHICSNGTLVYSDTNVSGIISNDTTWTKSNSPYRIVGNLGVEKGAILTIEPGVEVILDSKYYFQFKGKIIANGTENEPIIFSATNGQLSLIEFIETEWSGSSFSYVRFLTVGIHSDWEINSNNPNITIKNSYFEKGTGIDLKCNILIEDNIFTKVSQAILGRAGLVMSNIIKDGGNGISDNGGRLKIYYNSIYNNNGTGIYLVNSDYEIKYNSIYNNSRGISVLNVSSTIENNNLFLNGYNFYNGRYDIQVPNNWWGTTVQSEIDASIYDYYDDFKLGKVIYTPWLMEPDPNAPSIETVSTSDTPNGPTSGSTGVSYSYSTEGSTSNIGDPVQYFFDWGDQTNSGWLPVGTTNASHSWDSAGTYSVEVQTRCATHPPILSDWSETLSVTITSCSTPGTPSNPSPQNGATGVSINPTLGWSSCANTDSYDVYFGTSSPPSYMGNTTSTNYSCSDLSTNTTYYWQIVAKNNCGNETSGSIWSFTTTSPGCILFTFTNIQNTTAPPGGTIGPFTVQETNNTSSNCCFTIHPAVLKGDGTIAAALTSVDTCAPPGTRTHDHTLDIPSFAAEGTYTFGALLTDNSGKEIGRDTFNFTIKK